jgi:hypothetical protein
LKHIGPRAINFLTTLFNISVSKAELPAIWKAAVIVPIQKPGKPADLGPSCRPISLLSPAVKVLERLLLPIITDALPKSNTQHGFAANHSCTTALLPIATKVAIVFNDAKPAWRSALCAVDLSKAFNCNDHNLLLEQISSTDLHPNIIRWLASYIRGRTARCLYGSSLSIQMIIRSGVPQGSVLSPALFNFFVSDCPGNADNLAAYADDITAVKSDSNLSVLGKKLQEAVTPIA